MSLVHALLRRSTSSSRPTLAALVVAAIAIAVAGYEHFSLWQDGYRLIPNIGTAFLLNAIGSVGVIALLIARRDLLFALGGLSISVGSIVGIVLSRNGGFLGFQELGYDSTAVITLTAEIVATVLLTGYVVVTAMRARHETGGAASAQPGTGALSPSR